MSENDHLREIELVAELDKKRILVRRSVMSSESEYFRALFESESEENQNNEFVIPGVDGAMLKMIIDFCNTGEIEVNEVNVKQIVVAASSLEIERIKEKCANVWTDSLSSANCIDIFSEADKNSLQFLRKKSFDFICEKFETISSSKLVKVGKPFMMKLLRSNDIHAREDFIFERMMEWINYHKSTRSQYVTEMMRLIRMDRITQPFLRDVATSSAKKYNCTDLILREYIRRADAKDDDSSTSLIRSESTSGIILTLSCESGTVKVAKYYPIPNRWGLLGSFPIAGLATWTSFGVMLAIFRYPDQLIVIGGQENDSYIKKVDVYHLNQMALVFSVDLLEKRSHSMPIMFSNKLFVFGGFNGAAMHTCECFSMITRKFEKVASMQFGRYNFAGAAMDEKIYVAGGQTDATTHLNSVECYEPLNNKWTKIANMQNARANFALVSLNGMLYAMGDHKVVERYDPERNVWYEVGSFEGSETVIRAINSQNEIFVLLQDGRFGKLSMDAASCVFKELRNSPLSSENIQLLYVI